MGRLTGGKRASEDSKTTTHGFILTLSGYQMRGMRANPICSNDKVGLEALAILGDTASLFTILVVGRNPGVEPYLYAKRSGILI